MKNILLSIVVPIYNGGKRMSVLLDSIVGQLTDQMELILVNDGSKDETEKVCLEYASRYDQVKYLCQENTGVCVARELGVSILGGAYVAFADHDDWFEKDAITKLLVVLKNSSADMVIHQPVLCFNTKQYVLEFPVSCGLYSGIEMYEKVILPMMFGTHNHGQKGFNMGLWNCVFKKEIIEKNNIRLDSYLRMGEDFVYISQYMAVCRTIELTDVVLYHWLSNDDSVTHTHVPVNWWLGVEKSIYIFDKIAESLAKWPRETYEQYLSSRYANLVLSATRTLALTKSLSFADKLRGIRKTIQHPTIHQAIAKCGLLPTMSMRHKIELLLVKSKSPVLVIGYIYALLKMKEHRRQ